MSRSIGEIKLMDACGKPGCPVCRCVDDDGRRHLDGLLYEQVTDGDVRRRLRLSWGFCNWHAWLALGLPGARTGIAIVYEDVLRVLAQRFKRGRAGSRVRPAWRQRIAAMLSSEPTAASVSVRRGRAECVACVTTAAAEERYVAALLRLHVDREMAAAYAGSDGVCARHAVQACERDGRDDGLDDLLDQTIQKWERRAALLAAFVRKHEYRNTEPLTQQEADACESALDAVAGRAGVWGNDLHEPRFRSQRTRKRKTSRGA